LDEDLNYQAQQWADNMAKSGKLKHSHTGGVGECIASRTIRKSESFDSESVVTSLMNQWINEKKNVDLSEMFPHCVAKGTVGGHYTQIVWGKTKLLGVGYAHNETWSFLCCQYSPEGNYLMSYVIKIKKDTK
jgi:hypothetical protein